MVTSFMKGSIDFIEHIVNYERIMRVLTQMDAFPIGDF